jgi:hypothetical protein
MVYPSYSSSNSSISWVYSSLQKTLQGINGVVKVPLGIKISLKGRHSKIVLESKMLRWTRIMGFKPSYVLFDSWYASKKFFK